MGGDAPANEGEADMDGERDLGRARDGLGQIPPAPRRGVRIGVWIAVLAAVVFAVLLGVRVKQAIARKGQVATDRASAQESAKKRQPMRTVKPVATTWTPHVDVTGTLKPWRDADVGFETGGRLVRVGVSVGDKVPEGKVVAVLDASRAAAQVGQAESQVRAAEANLALAQDQLKRTEALAATHSIPEAQAEQARQQVALAKAQLDGAYASTTLAKSGAGLHTITAPFAGIVTKAPTGIGSVVNPGVPLVHIEDTSRFRLSVTVGEEEVPFVANGAKVKVVYRDHVVDGTVTAIVPSLDQATRRAPVEIAVPNADTKLLAWGFVRARIAGTGEVPAMKLPALARRPGSQDEIVKVEDGRAKVTRVAFATEEDGSLVVHRGLTESDVVLLAPSPELRDGEAVIQ